MDVWNRGAITGFYIRDRLQGHVLPTLRMAYIFGEDGLQGGGTCPVEKNWAACVKELAGIEGTHESVATCEATLDLRSISAWRPSPNDQSKRRIASELRREIEAHLEGAQAIVVRNFNLMDNEITMYVELPDADYYQGCAFRSNKEPHCESWHLFGQAPLSEIRKWIFAKPYRLK